MPQKYLWVSEILSVPYAFVDGVLVFRLWCLAGLNGPFSWYQLILLRMLKWEAKRFPMMWKWQFFFCWTRFGPVKGSLSMIHDELLPRSSNVQVYLIVFAKTCPQRAQRQSQRPQVLWPLSGWHIDPSRFASPAESQVNTRASGNLCPTTEQSAQSYS